MDDKHYSLAQFKAFIDECKSNMKTNGCIEEIFKPGSDNNCQIPTTELIKLEDPEIIGCTALHLALNNYKTDSFEQLLNRGADFTIKCNKGTTVLHKAIESSYNQSKECWKLKGQLAHPRANLVLSAHVTYNNLANPRDNHGMSHFHIACMLNHIEAVQFFLHGGVSPNEAIAENSTRLPGYSPLHIAARYCCFETAQLLLQYGADKNSRDIKNMTPLHLLIERRMEITDHMFTHKRAAYDFFKQELDLNEKLVKLFINNEHGNTTDDVGLSNFQAACTLQDTALVKKLLDQNVDFNHSVSMESPIWPGYTALHFAVHCNFETVRLLISHGANALAKDAIGVTPFDLCLERYDAHSIYFLLTKASSQWNLNDLRFSDGKTKVANLVHAMKSTLTFLLFLTEGVEDVNVFIPHDSPLWPGYTPMHLAAVFPERISGIEDLYDTTDYVEEDSPKNYYNCEETEETLHDERIILLLRKGADVTIPDAHGSTPIHLVFPLKIDRTFYWLLTYQEIVVNPVDKRGFSHLHIACATRHHPLVERILPTFSDNINDRTLSSFEYTFFDEDERKVRKYHVNPGSTLLHIAVASCNFTLIEMLLRHNANVYVQNSLGMTPIHLMLKSSGQLHLPKHKLLRSSTSGKFKKLLSLVNDWTDCVTDFGLSHLHVASYMNDATAIEKLLDGGANMETTIKCEPSSDSLSFLAPYDSCTPLLLAMHKERVSAIETLVNRDADFLANEASGLLLHNLLNYEYKDCPSRDVLLQTIQTDTTLQKRIFVRFGLTALHLACVAGDVDLIAELLKNGADPNAITSSNFFSWSRCTPLHLLVNTSHEYQSCYGIIELLLEHGADVTLANSVGDTPVHKRFRYCYTEGCDYLELLLKHQKDYNVNPINAEGVSHFHAACMCGNLTIIEEFLKHGVDVNLQVNNLPRFYQGYTLGTTPLHVAAYQNHGDVIDFLLRHGAKINARDCLGKTPLHHAARDSMNFEKLFPKLVSAAADIYARTLLGATALEELTWVPSHSSEIELLMKHGYRINFFNPLTQEGLIGMSLSNDTEDLSLNSFYEAVVEAFDDNDVDDMGRTPVHNIASCDGFKTSVEAIGEFLKIGYNIDHQDKLGRTALHCASSFRNDSGIIGLLEYGADINILDDNEQTAFTSLLEQKLKKTTWDRKLIQDIADIYVKHIYKLNILKLFVNELNSNVYAEMGLKTNLGEQFDLECQNELEEMKERTIDSLSISLFDFVSSETRVIAAYPNMPLPERQAIIEFFESDQNVLRKDFPHMSCLLYLQYRKALDRIDLVEPAKSPLNIQIGFNMPDLCSDIIFRFLTNQDLKNLIYSKDE